MIVTANQRDQQSTAKPTTAANSSQATKSLSPFFIFHFHLKLLQEGCL
jgi:hypothetical protein